MEHDAKHGDVILYRRLLAWAGGVYFLWWFVVLLWLPRAFNPLGSRLAIIALIFSCLVLSYRSDRVRKHLKLLFIACAWLITLHFFYLFYGNAGDPNWIVGAYITVIAISLCLLSDVAQAAYTVFVLILAAVLLFLLPALRDSLFLPGLVTTLLQGLISLRARSSVIKSLADSNARFQLLLHSTFEGLLVHHQGQVIETNEALSRITGYSTEEMKGKNVLDLVASDQRSLVASRLDQAEVAPYETVCLRKDGRHVDIEVRSKKFTYGRQTVKLVAVQDISDRKKAESERVKALTMAENVRVRDEFISIASHELKTPISALKLQAQLLEEELKSGLTTGEVEEVIDLFERQTDRLTELVDTLLDVSRISAGRLILEPEQVDLAALARDAVQSPAWRNGPRLQVEAPEPVVLQADRRRLEQVIENLIGNAVKYGDGKPVTISVRSDADEASLIVQDQGIGIAPESLPRIFDRFERAISARHISGFGLGLYIARLIVEAHGGRILAESQPGRGSTFTVRLPRGPVLTAPASGAAQNQANSFQDGSEQGKSLS